MGHKDVTSEACSAGRLNNALKDVNRGDVIGATDLLNATRAFSIAFLVMGFFAWLMLVADIFAAPVFRIIALRRVRPRISKEAGGCNESLLEG